MGSASSPSSAVQRGLGEPADLTRLQAVVLLGGVVRTTEFLGAIQRSLLDMPVDRHRTILGCWRNQVAELAARLECRPLLIRVMVDRASPAPRRDLMADSELGALVRIERDPFEYRGTGGVLRDLATAYGDDDYLLVATAAQLLLEPLVELVDALAAPGADVSILTDAGGVPAGLFLVRCAAIRMIAPAGFVDFKEQALPAIAARHRVVVVARPQLPSLPVRSPADYIDAVRRHHRRLAGAGDINDPFAENWRATFGLVEAGATVEANVRLHDSVVLSGARLRSGAVLVRSVVCEGAEVPPDSVCCDQVVSRHNGTTVRKFRWRP